MIISGDYGDGSVRLDRLFRDALAPGPSNRVWASVLLKPPGVWKYHVAPCALT